MPTYQYVCTQCATPLEAVQSFSEASLTECPTCGGLLRKKFSAVGVVFKGSGFYKNDSRPNGKKADAGAGEGAKADAPAAKSDGAKSDGAKGDAPKTDRPKGDSPKGDRPKSDAPKSPAKPAASSTSKT